VSEPEGDVVGYEWELETEFRNQLNETRVNSRWPSVKNAAKVSGVRIPVDAPATGHGIEIGVIEKVEELNAEL